MLFITFSILHAHYEEDELNLIQNKKVDKINGQKHRSLKLALIIGKPIIQLISMELASQSAH
jgi:hypothetical protein